MSGQGRGALGALLTGLVALGPMSLTSSPVARGAPAPAKVEGPRAMTKAKAAAGVTAKAAPRGEKQPRINAKSVLLVSFDGRKVLFERGATEVRSIASLSKLMATLVVAERKLDLQGITVMTQEDSRVASGGCRTRLLRGMKVRNQDLLHAALLASDNRAIPALGRAVGLTPVQLVEAMNARARRMGLRHTEFHDPVGIHHGNTSTAFEMAKILRAAVLHPVLQKVMRTQTYYFRPVWPKGRAINYYNTNALVHRLQYPVYGGKTGFNNKAGYCFASAMRLPGVGPVLAVILGSSSKSQRFADFFSMLRAVDHKGILLDRHGVAHKAGASKGAARKSAALKSASRKSASRKSVSPKSAALKSAVRKSAAPKSVALKSSVSQAARSQALARRSPKRPASGLAAKGSAGKARRPAPGRVPPRAAGSLHADSSD